MNNWYSTLGQPELQASQQPWTLIWTRTTWLKLTPAESLPLGMVAHWGVWYSLTGREFENCELVTCELGDLRVGAGKFVWG